MGIKNLEFKNVLFHYPDQSIDVFRDLDLSLGGGWTAVIGANGGGKSTLLKLASGSVQPLLGSVLRPASCVYVSQRTDDPPPTYDHFAYAWDALSCTLHGKLAIGRDYLDRWATLSHGERKRAQIGWALHTESDLLCIDEPTNHLDSGAMGMLVQALGLFRGIGLLVSHDLATLDALCTTTLIISSPVVHKVSCPPSQAMEEVAGQRDSAEAAYRSFAKEMRRIEREKKRRASVAQDVDRRNTKRHIARKDRDAKARVDAFRVSGGDKRAGMLSRQLDGRLERAHDEKSALAEQMRTKGVLDLKKESGGITITGSVHPSRSLLARQGGSIEMAPRRRLYHPPLALGNTDRVGIRGANGIGKSTLLAALVAELDETTVRFWYLAQELGIEESRAAYQEFCALEGAIKGRIVSALVRMGSSADLFLSSALPSPGEMRKLLIAWALEDRYSLLILDEPTNHLDLPSRRALAAQLQNFAGAMLLVSHDRAFLDRICTTWWDISSRDGNDSTLAIT
ncbi:MAG: ATP-binding cassette domain-containing protein [Sphaerochaeta sp.]|nr:ATP-binding cassette domain-containing protein [Sphaerochaeta sp.]